MRYRVVMGLSIPRKYFYKQFSQITSCRHFRILDDEFKIGANEFQLSNRVENIEVKGRIC